MERQDHECWGTEQSRVITLKSIPFLKSILVQMNLRWLGHVERMDHNRLPWQLLYSQLKEGSRNQGRPMLRFKDAFKRNMKKLDIDSASWQNNSRNRDSWRRLIRPKCRQSLSHPQIAMMMTTTTTATMMINKANYVQKLPKNTHFLREYMWN